MGKKNWLLAISLALGLAIVGLAGCVSEEPPVIPPVIPVTPTLYSSISIPIEEFPNHPHIDVVMHAVVGEELTVTLGSNPTTGFQWSEYAEINDESVIKQVSHKFVGPGIDKPPGTPGEEVWTFEALKKGTVITFLEYSRPWIEEDVGHWTVTITTTIK